MFNKLITAVSSWSTSRKARKAEKRRLWIEKDRVREENNQAQQAIWREALKKGGKSPSYAQDEWHTIDTVFTGVVITLAYIFGWIVIYSVIAILVI